MNKIPDGALLQKSKNNVSYVYFPSYYYDKDAKTHNKEKQKRLYVGKVVGGEFVPNKKYLANPELSRKDVGSLVSAPADLSKIQTRSFGATSLLNSLADKVGLTADLTSVYGEDMAKQLLSLAMFMTIDSQSALSLYPLWQKRFWVQNPAFSAEDSKVSVEPNTATPQMASVFGSCGTAGFTPAIFMSPKKDSKPR